MRKLQHRDSGQGHFSITGASRCEIPTPTPPRPLFVRYEESQRVLTNPLTWVTFPPAAWMWYEFIALLTMGRPSETAGEPLPTWGVITLFAAVGVAMPTLALAMRMRTRIDTDLHISYRPFSRVRIAPDRVLAVEAIKFRPMRDCLGWGIRCYRGGRALTVWGNKGVLMRYIDRKGRERTVLVGSRRHKELAGAIKDFATEA